jgi:DNA-directed RNA polymerase I subunit RPA43
MSYDKLKILDTHAQIFYERPQLHFNIQVQLLVFRPVVGSYVVGVVNKLEPDHIGLLVNGIFNASVVAATGFSQDYEYQNSSSQFVNSTTGQVIAAGTKLRVQIVKISHFTQVLSLECTMLDEQTGFV